MIFRDRSGTCLHWLHYTVDTVLIFVGESYTRWLWLVILDVAVYSLIFCCIHYKILTLNTNIHVPRRRNFQDRLRPLRNWLVHFLCFSLQIYTSICARNILNFIEILIQNLHPFQNHFFDLQEIWVLERLIPKLNWAVYVAQACNFNLAQNLRCVSTAGYAIFIDS